MVNLSQVKFSWRNNDSEILRILLDALVGCRLEEFDFTLHIPYLEASVDSTLLMTATKLEGLQVRASWNRTSFPLGQANWVGDLLSNTPKLTHLSFTIPHATLSVNLLDYTWPNLENLFIDTSNISPTTDVPPPPSKFTDFFKRHPKLTTLSLHCNVYPPSTSPLVTVECLPKLESFSYDGPLGVPLSLVLSPASARRLRHLTVHDNAVPLEPPNNMDIHKELTSLKTLCFTLVPWAVNYDNINQTLEVLAEHAIGLQKIHIPTTESLFKRYLETLIILQRFPKLTHLSGMWPHDINRHDFFLWQLYQCPQLEYVINIGHDKTPCVSRLIRKIKHSDKYMMAKLVSEKNPDCDMRTWGDVIPGVGYGTWKIPRPQTVKEVTQAVEAGFDHIDTAQSYANETEAGQALRQSGLPRSSVWITTKFSGQKSVEDSIKDSLNNLGVRSVDLYLVHSPRLANGNIPGLWKRFEKIKSKGSAKNIGVSNFTVSDLQTLLKDAKVVPAVNQILLHPYVYQQQKPIIDFCNQKGIAIEAYSPLIPVTSAPGGPVDIPLEKISKRTGATYDQILLAWNKAKGSIVLSSSSKPSRLEGYRKAGDIGTGKNFNPFQELTADEIAEIDSAGAKGPNSWFSEDVIPNNDARSLTLIFLVAISFVATTALWVCAHVFNLV
ncbi:hypothetical protein Clacol_007129 [Clathrus columnatus]|uniref:NADP-dependent oxidoreductase domain-containing protein n=1 Tax=Clathrus columnatus TaxID=1419009 RepID=A0AAV5AJM4_9AGAM|nr:hypothetical protein Clacol_007129 [Clathrus columnatus]